MLNQNPSPAAFCSGHPLRILNRGPEYFQKPARKVPPSLSAVERLEADKAKYVKSRQLVGARQDPVRPDKSVPRHTVSQGHGTPGKPGGDGRTERAVPNPEILSPWGVGYLQSTKHPEGESTHLQPSPSVPAHRGVVRRVDVRPNICRRFRRWPEPSPARSQLSPRKGCSELTPRRRLSPCRSESQSSEQRCPTQADLEHFFNYCGLDPEELEAGLAQQLAQPGSDILSLKLQSVSACSSQHTHHTAGERTAKAISYGVSIIERNARIIKWLYSCREANSTQSELSI